ncbi:MAG: hypothetical protein HY747_11170, partial [Elusimicrobia bacterium]|nr:hypothetical protein [Elusimicrobiota bacterium]
VGIQRNSDGYWYREQDNPSADQPCLSGGGGTRWCQNRVTLDAPVDNLVGANWTFALGDPFYAGRTTETYKVYFWARDLVDSAYRNANSSLTMTTLFHYESMAPSSTLIAPASAACNQEVGQWYSEISTFSLPSLIGTAFDRPESSTNVGYGPSPSTWTLYGGPLYFADSAEIQVRDVTFTGNCWNGSAFPATQSPVCGVTTWQQMTFWNSSWTYSTSGLFSATQSGGRYEVKMRGKGSAIDDAGGAAAAPTVSAVIHVDGTKESNPNIEDAANNAESGRNCRSFRVDKSSPAAGFTSLAHDSSYASGAAGVTNIEGTASDSGSEIPSLSSQVLE